MIRGMACALWVLLLLPAGLAGSAEHTPAAPGEWGAERGGPTDAGFFFWNGSYVRTPYIVERRGLDIHINGILVSRGPDWSISVPSEDPGQPPPGASPFDPFFGEKWRYLSSCCGRREAMRLMLQAYRQCDGFSAVAERDGAIRVTEKETGDEAYITLSDSWKMALQSREQLLSGRAAKKRYFEELLRRNRVVSLSAGDEHIIAGNAALMTLGVLLSNETPQGKIRILEQRGILRPGDAAAQRIVTEYREDAQLLERYGRLAGGERSAKAAGITRGETQPAMAAQSAETSRAAPRLPEAAVSPRRDLASCVARRSLAGCVTWREPALCAVAASVLVLMVWRRRRTQ